MIRLALPNISESSTPSQLITLTTTKFRLCFFNLCGENENETWTVHRLTRLCKVCQRQYAYLKVRKARDYDQVAALSKNMQVVIGKTDGNWQT